MAQPEEDDLADDIESLNDEVELDSFLDVMEQKNESRESGGLTARRRIEDLLEERRLRQLLDDYPDDFDEEE